MNYIRTRITHTQDTSLINYFITICALEIIDIYLCDGVPTS